MITAIALVLVLSSVLGLAGKLLRKKVSSDRDLQRPFECGFPTLNESRISFSLHFFMVALVFAVFDVEILILFPLTIDALSITSWPSIAIYIALIIILTIGLINEWNQLILEWSK